MLSHPTWVRGLKSIENLTTARVIKSHPTWVRGLKSYEECKEHKPDGVAPYLGAWIEIATNTEGVINVKVAPYLGAWIEIMISLHWHSRVGSHPTWVRGLK